MWYWLFKYVLLGPLLWLMGRPKLEGGENIPTGGPAILASNHRAVLDSFYLPLLAKRRITFLAKSEYFTGTGLKGGFQRWFFSAVGQVPIDRTARTPRRTHSTPVSEFSRRANCSASIRKAPVRPTDVCTRARPVWHVSHSRPECRSFPSR